MSIGIPAFAPLILQNDEGHHFGPLIASCPGHLWRPVSPGGTGGRIQAV